MDAITETEIDLYDIMHNPAVFPEFITPVNARATDALPMRDWYIEDHFGRTRLYQLSMLPWDHSLPGSDEVIMHKAYEKDYRGIDRVSLGNANDFGGRKTSKSFTLDHDAQQAAIVREGEHTLITSRDDNHVTQRMNSLKKYIATHPFISRLVSHYKMGHPFAEIHWFNGHTTLGVYESTTGKGSNYESMHVHRILIEEFQLTSAQAYKKLFDCSHELGCVVRTIGVSDGRIDTPAHEVRQNELLRRQVHIHPQYMTAFWTPARKKLAAKQYGGTESHDYRTNVAAEEGEASLGVWNMDDYRACIAILPEDAKKPIEDRRRIPCPALKLSGKHLADDGYVSDLEFPPVRDADANVILSVDTGYRPDPTVIFVWGIDRRGVPRMWGKIVLQEVIAPHQARFLLRLIRFYQAETVGLDATGMDGRNIAQDMQDKKGDIEYKLALWDSRSNIEEEIDPDESVDKELRNKENLQIKKTPYLEYFTTKLRTRFALRQIETLDDPATELEFQNEVAKRSSGSSITNVKYSSPVGDHSISAFRVMELIMYSRGVVKQKARRFTILTENTFFPLGWV